MKIALIIGTRPEIIKMAPVIDEIQKRGINYLLVHSGQHYNHEMSDQFFIDLELKKPDYNVGVGSGSHGEQTANMIKGIEKVLIAEKPDLVLVQGDTNAVLSGAIVASKLHIPVGHVEAGLRSYDKSMPEEINREVADVCSKLFFVPTEESALNLLFAGLNREDIFITGNTIVDACIRNLKIAKKREEMDSMLDFHGNIMTLTMHRAENVDNPERLQNIVDALVELNELTIVFPVHPRTLKNLKKFNLLKELENAEHIKLIKPAGYLKFLLLLSNSTLIMTDSGGLQEEAITLDIPCLTLRYNTERPETVKSGGNILVGADKEKIIENVREIINSADLYNEMKNAHNPYGDGNSSSRIVSAILSLYNDNKLKISVPENIMKNKSRKLIKINENINLKDFERINNNLKVNIVFKDNNPQYPYSELDLKDKFILVEYLS